MDTKQVIARFEAERQALAMMDHPGIAKVFDAGATETGPPLLRHGAGRGRAHHRVLRRQRLSTRQRLELFNQVCAAVQHAHQKGIIHRDIKPSNVLVSEVDGQAVPKVIDFGIAKATNQRLTEKTLFTQQAQFIGTPAYMSPEQAERHDSTSTPAATSTPSASCSTSCSPAHALRQQRSCSAPASARSSASSGKRTRPAQHAGQRPGRAARTRPPSIGGCAGPSSSSASRASWTGS